LNNQIQEEVDNFFTNEELDILAKDFSFVKRASKLNGSTFFNLIVFYNDNLKNDSLNDLSGILKKEFNVNITKQSLHERFNKNSVLFLSNAFEKLLRDRISSSHTLKNCSNFKRILIKDSVCFQIDESLAEYYPGSGGSGSKASVRIQFEYEILSGTITDISISAFNTQDAKDSITTIELIKQGDLIIRDLAYMHLAVLDKIINKFAYFLCRLNTKTKVYQVKGEKFVEINFSKIAKKMRKFDIPRVEEHVYIGEKEKLKVRLVICLMPDAEYNKRIRKAQINAKNKGRQLGKDFRSRASLNLFITNADYDSITTDNAWSLYRLRWQIELMFKIWKSTWEIDEVKKVKKERLECYILSKLLIIVLCWRATWVIAKELYRIENKSLSFIKAFKTLRRYASELKSVFIDRTVSAVDYFVNLYNISRTMHLLEKKGKQESSFELLMKSLIFTDVKYDIIDQKC